MGMGMTECGAMEWMCKNGGLLTVQACLSLCFGDVIIPSDIICAQPIMYLISFSSVFTGSFSSDVVELPCLFVTPRERF